MEERTRRTACVYLIRHGETDWNKIGKLQGQTDTNLTEWGRQQAEEVGAFFGKLSKDVCISEVVSSDLKRCMHTAQAITRGIAQNSSGDGLSITPDERLRERHLGILQGYTWEECQTKHREVFQQVWGFASGDDARPPEGESENDVKERTAAALRDFCCRLLQGAGASGSAAPAGVVVSHGGALYAMSHAFGREDDGSGSLKNCSVSAIHVSLPAVTGVDLDQELMSDDSSSWWDRVEWSIDIWGNTSHLSGKSMQDLQSQTRTK
jgi:broad specificity phosphatase PhoE